ncbi:MULTISPECIES: lipid IV(A) 3-deoxy-D-manno-octulosonic acid transferase [Pseudomonas]|uniref:3-deoxy-D-manno-octulosonic acid transferase n=2 Tax=Pseudomonadaceae TaxID=135621 RepID=A0A0D0KR10_9PSED|nr:MULTISPECIES: lipid IV(A) 3-deoxy-D-manno-octulosonic acid transferase [Pseudomonas]KIQ00517.1 3-deoxy-D-manno-octulosonic acid transferase [Pseudomonas fulva]MCW2290235.1 3-deoxy-D-manno-octulosonic-acid transferase [Pseudomonas sp. BIGb0408]NYH75192.1 3-deoxy-D-manno-octulosonic-acid transferase [Pseudomonas flavescens]
MNRYLYSLLFHLCLPLIGLRLIWRAWRAPAYTKRVGERFALGLPPLRPGGIWVHAVSVGESIAAAPLVRELLARYPDLPITLTCMTPTGSERIRALFPDAQFAGRVQHCYLPYDLPWAASRFLERVRPRLAVIMETELWPNYIHQCARRGIPVALANGRLSERSARGYGRFAKLTAPMLAELNLLAVQSQVEAQRFVALGARPETVEVTGSIKFDQQVDTDVLARATALRERWQAQRRPVWIAASTREGEDALVIQAHQQLLATQPDALLILVPRHLERFDSAAAQLREVGLTFVRRSSGEAVDPGVQVLLGDSMGELMFLYGLADVAFVGGSLVETGGHNPLEPAALGLPVIMGPHRFNFQEITAQLLERGALCEVADAKALGTQVAVLLHEPPRAAAMREAGLAVLKSNQGALQRLLDGLGRLIV